MKSKYWIFLVVILLLIGFVILKQHTTTKHELSGPTQNMPLPKEVTITLNKDGFSPKEVTIKPGVAIRWKNVSGDKQTVNSDDYPTNQLHRELNFGIFSSGSSVVYTFTKTGTYGFHNQFHPEQKGKVVVSN